MLTEIKQNPVEIFAESIIEAVEALRKHATADSPIFTLVPSGGRMGGSSFSSALLASSSSRCSCSGSSTSDNVNFFSLCASLLICVSLFVDLITSEKTSVLKLQFALLGSAKSLQKDLNLIAETADTSTSEGLHYVLTEQDITVIRTEVQVSEVLAARMHRVIDGHKMYLLAGHNVDVKWSMEDGEKIFNQLSIEERVKFDVTLVNINNTKKQSLSSPRAGGFSKDYIVITILVAARGKHKQPSINNSKDLKEALQKLTSIPASRTLGVEVLWSPQKEDDTLLEQEMLENYALLRPL